MRAFGTCNLSARSFQIFRKHVPIFHNDLVYYICRQFCKTLCGRTVRLTALSFRSFLRVVYATTVGDEVTSLSGQQVGLLTAYCKRDRFPNSVFPQLQCKPNACVAPIWAYHIAFMRLGNMGNWCKYVMLLLLAMPWVIECFVSDSRVLCFLPASMK